MPLVLIIFIVLLRASANVHTLSYASVSINGLELVLRRTSDWFKFYKRNIIIIVKVQTLTPTVASLDMLPLIGYCCITRALSSTDASSSSVQLTSLVDLHQSSEYQPYNIQAKSGYLLDDLLA